MIFTFYKARGFPVGASMVEDTQTDLAKQLVSKAAEKGIKLLLPTDIIVADKYAADAQTQVVSADQIPEGWMVRPSFSSPASSRPSCSSSATSSPAPSSPASCSKMRA